MATAAAAATSGALGKFAEQWETKAIKEAELELVNVVSATLLFEPRYYSSADATRTRIMVAVEKVVAKDPEFVLQLAFYVREELNIRSTANFLLALSALHKQCLPFLAKYFCHSVRLPTDLMEIYALISNLNEKRIPAAMRKVMVAKFQEFDEYQLAKYNNEGKIKRKKRKEKIAAKIAAEKKAKTPVEEIEAEEEKEELPARASRHSRRGMRGERKRGRTQSVPEDAGTEKPQLPTLKFLIRTLHIAKPANLVMSILGHKYPANEEEFKKSGLTGDFDPTRAGTRMKLRIPETWETQLSALGNRPEVWLSLIDSKKLPFMAMLRNLRNLLLCGLPERAHDWVIEQRLSNEGAVAASRQFPFRFFSAYSVLQQIEKGELETSKRKKPQRSIEGEAVFRGHLTPEQLEKLEKREARLKEIEEKRKTRLAKLKLPSAELIARYKAALDEAVKISIRRNITPIRGYTVAMADISGSMHCNVSSAKGGTGSITRAYEISILMSLLVCHICEKSDMYLFGTHGAHPKPYFKIEVPIEKSILENMEFCKRMAEEKLTGGNEYFYELFEEWISKKIKVDRMLVFTDVAIDGLQSQGSVRHGGVEGIVTKYREQVNPNFAYITVDLYGSGRSNVSVGADSHPGNILISGYSDQIFRFVGTDAASQMSYIKSIDKTHKLFNQKNKA